MQTLHPDVCMMPFLPCAPSSRSAPLGHYGRHRRVSLNQDLFWVGFPACAPIFELFQIPQTKTLRRP